MPTFPLDAESEEAVQSVLEPHAELVRRGGHYASLVRRQHRGLIPEE